MNVIEIKKRNLELGISPKDWAKCLDITVQHAYKKIEGKSHLTLHQANQVQKMLQIKDEDFALYFLSRHSRIS